MSTYVIYWWNPLYAQREWEEFDSLDDAAKALDQWTIDYPWNRYSLARVETVAEPTAGRPLSR